MTTPRLTDIARIIRPAHIAATLALAVASSATSQQTPQPGAAPPEIYTEVLDIDLVNVDVYVTDKDGNAVLGLTRDDFELQVQGRPVAVSNFYAIEGGERAGITDEEKVLIEEEAAKRIPIDATPIERQRAAVPPDQRLHIVIYIDNFNLSPFKRNRVISELREFLRTKLQPTDEVMLVSYDRFLNLRRPFTFRGDEISRALIELEDISAQKIHRDRERLEVWNRIEESESVGQAYQMAQDFAGSYRNDISFSLDALRSIIDGLAGSGGRKAVVYVSEGLPLIVGEDLFQQILLKFSERASMTYATEFDMSNRYMELANQANANRVSFYTVDATGLSVLTQGTVDQEIKGQAGERSFIDHVNRSNLQSSIQLLAERTGGRATINANRYMPAFDAMASDFRNYYSLGFLGTDTSDGRYHRFSVRLKNKQKGVNIRHRDGYRSKSVDTKMHDFTMSALNLDLQENPLRAQITVRAQERQLNGLYKVQLMVLVPRDELTFFPVEDKYYTKIGLWLAAKDLQDGITPMRQIPLVVNLTKEQYDRAGQHGFPYPITLEMAEGYTDVAIGIRDELGARASYIREGIRVGR